MTMRLAGIRRKTEFSPNHVVNDSLIIQRTGDALAAMGAEIAWYDEGTVSPEEFRERAAFSMAQGPAGSAALAKIEDRGVLIVNSPRSVMNCYRTSMVTVLPGAGIPFPKSVVVETDAAPDLARRGFPSGKVWVKRGDVHAVHKEDVTLASSPDEASTLLREFRARDIRQAVLQEHLEGDTVKFYAVRGSDLFHWYYLNGVRKTPFRAEDLRGLASAAAEALGLHVYGGDAIVGGDASLTIIDINDWPSFAPVREDASRAIADLVFRQARHHLR